MALKSI